MELHISFYFERLYEFNCCAMDTIGRESSRLFDIETVRLSSGDS